jgi:hypothetical protein
MEDDVITYELFLEATDEIERLRRTAQMMAIYIHSIDKERDETPDMIYCNFYDEACRG